MQEVSVTKADHGALKKELVHALMGIGCSKVSAREWHQEFVEVKKKKKSVNLQQWQ